MFLLNVTHNLLANHKKKQRGGTVACSPYLGRGYFDVDDDGSEGGLGQLGGLVDGVRVQGDQLEGAGQLEDALDLTLHLR